MRSPFQRPFLPACSYISHNNAAPPAPPAGNDDVLSAGAIAGIVIGAVVLAAAAAGGFFYWRRREARAAAARPVKTGDMFSTNPAYDAEVAAAAAAAAAAAPKSGKSSRQVGVGGREADPSELADAPSCCLRACLLVTLSNPTLITHSPTKLLQISSAENPMFGSEEAGEAGGNPLFAGGAAGGRGDDSPLGPGSVKTGREMSSAANPMFGGEDAGDASNPLYGGGGGGECLAAV